ncbi:hypothetical protein CASFOL_010557 [Castilleja foliolosa]|uniref:Poor homologous synapsis 1 PH domain-containing protein n=1 Tax=Castilleja foliolosa TaxID=1961234 RepID=A0ABD3DV43_9LAMI
MITCIFLSTSTFTSPSMSSSSSPNPSSPKSTPTQTHSGHNIMKSINDKWQVQYSRFINYSSVTCTRTHPSLSPVEKSRRSRGSWISTAAATLKLAYRRSPTGLCESVITISLQSQVLVSEEHYVSKMLFSWVSGKGVQGYFYELID